MIGLAVDVEIVVLLVLLAGLAGGAAGLRRRRAQTADALGLAARRIVFPFVGTTLSEPALEAALRLALAERAILVPVYLAQLPRHLALDAPIERRAESALELLEAIEVRATRAGVHVDGRIERGRTVRHACRQLFVHERFDRMLVAAATDGHDDGLDADDIAWLLRRAPGEVVVVRPAATQSPEGLRGAVPDQRRSTSSALVPRGV
jgi:hypothetical protein